MNIEKSKYSSDFFGIRIPPQYAEITVVMKAAKDSMSDVPQWLDMCKRGTMNRKERFRNHKHDNQNNPLILFTGKGSRGLFVLRGLPD